MRLKNLMEDEVMYVTNELLSEREDVCKCQKCKLDIAAIALNALSPKYVVTEIGELLGRANNSNIQFEADVITEVTKAIDVVKNSPHHD